MKHTFVLAMLICAASLPASTTDRPTVEPETAFVSPSQYTNAFFGFLLPLPTDPPFQEAPPPRPSTGQGHVLLFLHATTASFNYKPKLTALTISAKESPDSSSEALRKAATGLLSTGESPQPQRVEIAGKEFWRPTWEEKSAVGTIHSIKFATASNGYVLTFLITSFDGKLAGHLQRDVERIKFFDPSKAAEVAGAGSRSYPPPLGQPVASPTPSHIAQLSPGVVSGNTYRNETLGFSFQFPAGWALADKDTQEKIIQAGHQLADDNDLAAAREHSVVDQCSKRLLWANKYPEGTKTDEINPLIVIIAFDADCLPGVALPSSPNDTGAIRQLGTQIARTLSGTPFVGKGQNSLRTFTVQNRLMLDLSSAFEVEVPNRKEPWHAFTSIIFTKENSYWVFWIFEDGSQSGLDGLRNEIKVAFVLPAANAQQK